MPPPSSAVPDHAVEFLPVRQRGQSGAALRMRRPRPPDPSAQPAENTRGVDASAQMGPTPAAGRLVLRRVARRVRRRRWIYGAAACNRQWRRVNTIFEGTAWPGEPTRFLHSDRK